MSRTAHAQVLIVEQYRVTRGAPETVVHLIDAYDDSTKPRWDDDKYPDPHRDEHDALLKSYRHNYRNVCDALADGWTLFQVEEIPVPRSWWTGKLLDTSQPEHAYFGRRWWLAKAPTTLAVTL